MPDAPFAAPPAEVGTTTAPSAELSLPEMLRIMDVATALRKDRELVDQQLRTEDFKAKLRDRLIEAARVTGEEVTPAEVDAAIDRYYRQRHAFREPGVNVQIALAHLYVRRWPIAKWGGGLLAAGLACWFLFLSPAGPFTVTGRAQRRVERLSAEAATRARAVNAIAEGPAATAELERLAREAEASKVQADPDRLAAAAAALGDLEARLREEYTVTVVSRPGEKSAVDRYFTDESGRRASGYYLIVEARTPRGETLKRRARNAETGREADVTVWAERVPKEVYDRLRADKQADGVLDETTFAVKRPGRYEEEVVMPGPGGAPLDRLGQITEW